MYCNFQYLSELLDYREDIVFSIMFEAGNSHPLGLEVGDLLLLSFPIAITFF